MILYQNTKSKRLKKASKTLEYNPIVYSQPFDGQICSVITNCNEHYKAVYDDILDKFIDFKSYRTPSDFINNNDIIVKLSLGELVFYWCEWEKAEKFYL